MNSRLRLCFVILVSLMPLNASATVYDEFRGIRSAGMGGTHRGIGTSNDALLLNPAGMAILSRYSIELDYGYNKRDDLSRAHFSAVDSKSSPVAAGVGYTYVRGDPKNTDPSMHFIYVGMAYRIADAIAFGISSKNLRGEFTEGNALQKYDVYTGDIGAQFNLGDSFSIGLTYLNLRNTDVPQLTPPSVGAGISYRWNELVVGADLDADITDSDNSILTYRGGAEYFYNRIAPIRIGYTRSPFIKKDGTQSEEDIISCGLGYLSQTGSLDVSFSRSVQRARNWTLIGGMKFFL